MTNWPFLGQFSHIYPNMGANKNFHITPKKYMSIHGSVISTKNFNTKLLGKDT